MGAPGPELWDLDGDGRRWAIVVNGLIRYVGSREECQRRITIINAEKAEVENGRKVRDQALKQILGLLVFFLLSLAASSL